MKMKSLYTAVVMLAAVAMVLCIFLTFAHYASAGIACLKPKPGQESGCDVVNKSIYAGIFGVPVALIGFFGYAVIGATGLVGLGLLKPKGDLLDDVARRPAFYLMLLALGGFSFTLYLNYIQIFVIGRICFLCEISAAIITSILVLSAILWMRERKRG